MNDYYTDYEKMYDDPVFVVFLLGLGVISYIVSSLAMMFLFKKMGIESWKAWVPIYRDWIFYEQGRMPGYVALAPLLAWIPLLGALVQLAAVVIACIAAYRIGKDFGKSDVWVVLYIFVPVIWMFILGLDDSQYNKTINTINNNNNGYMSPPPAQTYPYTGANNTPQQNKQHNQTYIPPNIQDSNNNNQNPYT